MKILVVLSIVAIIIALVFWYQSRTFISHHVKKYNKYTHLSDFKHLADLKSHDETHVSIKAHKHHRNTKIVVFVIITAILILISQNVN